MRPGITFQVYQPQAAAVPGLVIFGEDDHFFARPSQAENLAVVPSLRKRSNALWNIAVEPGTGHGPGEKTWPLVFSFLRHTFSARVPAPCDCREGPVTLKKLMPEELPLLLIIRMACNVLFLIVISVIKSFLQTVSSSAALPANHFWTLCLMLSKYTIIIDG